MTPTEWPSLFPQTVLAKRLFGTRGMALLGRWLDQQVERIIDPSFARLFTEHIHLPGVTSGDYNHRLIKADGGWLLGGIRFYSGDTNRPFVEIVAHSFQDWNLLRDCAAQEWDAFAPRHLRTLVPCETELPTDGYVDMTVYAARYRDMASPDGRVSLIPFADAEQAISMVAERYAELASADPALAQNISPAGAADLKRWQDENQMQAIRAVVDGRERTVGLFAAAPGTVAWIEGDEVCEEIIMAACNGRGFAASAQKAWTARSNTDPDRLLVGTIDGLNFASRRTAARAGREAVLDYVFVSLK